MNNQMPNSFSKIAVVGLGYVGLPLSLQFARSGVPVLGLDLDPDKIDLINRGESYLKHFSSNSIKEQVDAGRFEATTDSSRVSEVEAILICVPTPLNEYREPDLSYVLDTAENLAPHLPKGVLVVLESTTYPGTTEDELRMVLEQGSGMKAGVDFHLAYSPEREDPGREDASVKTIPKVVGGYTKACGDLAENLYGEAIDKNFLNPIRVYAMVKYTSQSTTTTPLGVDRIEKISVAFHKRRLTEDQDLFVREGDFIQHGEHMYEILTLEEPKWLFGQTESRFEIAATCVRAREGLFNVRDN